jgi:competence protein ComEA
MIRTLSFAAALLAAAPALAQTAPAPKPQTAVAAPAPAVQHATMTREAVRVDINTATVDQIAGVKGMTRPLAEAIVKGRPFKSTDELTKSKILPENVFAQVKDSLSVK